ncbi:hypothetical protein D3C72_847720 [compost metagenome]
MRRKAEQRAVDDAQQLAGAPGAGQGEVRWRQGQAGTDLQLPGVPAGDQWSGVVKGQQGRVHPAIGNRVQGLQRAVQQALAHLRITFPQQFDHCTAPYQCHLPPGQLLEAGRRLGARAADQYPRSTEVGTAEAQPLRQAVAVGQPGNQLRLALGYLADHLLHARP